MFNPDDPGMDEVPEMTLSAANYDALTASIGFPPGLVQKNPSPPMVILYPWGSNNYYNMMPGNPYYSLFNGLDGFHRIIKGS